MVDVLPLLLGVVLANNLFLMRRTGKRPLFDAHGKLDTAWILTLATVFVLTLSATTNYMIDHFVLIPLGLQYLRIASFIVVIGAVVQFTEIAIRAGYPLTHRTLGIYLPLTTTTCSVLLAALLASQRNHSLASTIVYALGTAFCFALVMAMFAALCLRIDEERVPRPFLGAPIYLITAGLLSLAFMGFKGTEN